MSVAEFSEALKSAALKNWFQRLSTDNILKMSAKDIRKKEAGKEFNSFYITENTISTVIEKLTGAGASPADVEKVFKNLQKVVYGTKNKAKGLNEPYVEGKGLYYPRVSFDTINTILEKGFEEVLTKARLTNPDLKISDYFQRGHVFGIFPQKVAETRKSLEHNSTLTPAARTLLTGILTELEAELKAEDLATSNLKTPGFTLYARYEKKATKYLVELQLKEVNEAAGREQAALSKAIRKYFNPGAVTFTASGIKFTEGEAEQRVKGLIERNIERLIGTKGSPSMLDLIEASIRNALIGKPNSDVPYSIPITEIAKATPSKVNTAALNKKVKDDLKAIKKLKASIAKVPQFKVASTGPSLTSLLVLLNKHLQDVISANMGNGNATNVLNYRTGRLAASAKVERLSQSKEGMITAFYSYMRNPYGTFSEGGDRQYPRSRDPKTLIGSSIKEIAATMMVTRMRAVLV